MFFNVGKLCNTVHAAPLTFLDKCDIIGLFGSAFCSSQTVLYNVFPERSDMYGKSCYVWQGNYLVGCNC